MKFYGPVIVLNYGYGERMLKVEISNRQWNDRYEIKNLLGIEMKVMDAPHMFAHKLCTLLDRSEVASRDIFDSWFFLQRRTFSARVLLKTECKFPLINICKNVLICLRQFPTGSYCLVSEN